MTRRFQAPGSRLRALVGGVLLSLASVASAQEARLADAAERQGSAAVRALLADGADPNLGQPDGATALHWAAHWNDLQMVEALLGAGANPNAVNELGVVPLARAALNASAEVGQALLGAGADPNLAKPSGETVLMAAARTGSAPLVEALLNAGADVEPTTHFKNQTPLMLSLIHI